MDSSSGDRSPRCSSSQYLEMLKAVGSKDGEKRRRWSTGASPYEAGSVRANKPPPITRVASLREEEAPNRPGSGPSVSSPLLDRVMPRLVADTPKRRKLSEYQFMPAIPEEPGLHHSSHPAPLPSRTRASTISAVCPPSVGLLTPRPQPTLLPPVAPPPPPVQDKNSNDLGQKRKLGQRKKWLIPVIVFIVGICIGTFMVASYYILTKPKVVSAEPACEFGPWGEWSACTATSRCTWGIQTRPRQVLHGCSVDYDGQLEESRACSLGCSECSFFLSDGGRGIIWSFREGGNLQQVTDALDPGSIAYDHQRQLLFWTEDYQSHLKLLDLTSPNRTVQILLDLKDQPLESVAVDPDEQLAFVSEYRGGISRVNYNMTDDIQIVAESFGSNIIITLDIQKKRLFWIDSGTKKLEASSFGGNERRTIVTDVGHGDITGLVYYSQGEQLFWLMSQHGEVRSVSVDGSGITTLTTSYPAIINANSLVICQDHLYLSHNSTKSVYALPVSGGDLELVLRDSSQLAGPLSLAVNEE